MTCILAVDAGGTRTQAALVTRAGLVPSRREGAGANAFDRPDWLDNLHATLAPLLAASPQALVLGLAGFSSRRPSSAAQSRALADWTAPLPTQLCSDADIALDGALGGQPGILALSGTGSIVLARAADGTTLRVGGWGYLLGDEGSGYAIGRDAMRHLTQWIDAGAPADDPPDVHRLARRLAQRLGIAPTPDGLLEWLRGQPHPRSAIAAQAAFVATCADEGLPEAIAILHQAAEALAGQVRTAATRAGLPDGPWSHSGSIFNSRPFLAHMETTLGTPPLPPVLPPLGGAALRAARLAGWPVTPEWIATLAASLAAPP